MKTLEINKIEKEILTVLDDQDDGFIVPNQTDFNKYDIRDFYEALDRLITKGVLRKRECAGAAYEYNN